MRALRAPVAVLLLFGCGELSNGPLRTGAVEGVVADADSKAALVTVMGQPGLRAGVGADGRFLLERVPAGAARLFIVASRSHAALVTVTVSGARTTSISIQPEPGAFVRYELKTAAMQSGERVLVSLEGTPFIGLPFESGGARRVGPLPAGCYPARIRSDAFGERQVETCVAAGEQREVEVDFTESDARCEQTGCEAGLRCADDGRCVECLATAECAQGLSCNDGNCEGAVAACAPCGADAQCGGSSCESASGTSLRYCAVSCTDRCPQPGFTCSQGLCVPNPAVFNSCAGYDGVGTPCDSDSYCRDLGLYGGECQQGTCTMRCAQNSECPNATTCTQAGADFYCLRP